jgi:hypothetical protein
VLVRAQKERTWFGKAGENSTIWESASLKFIMGGSDEQKYDQWLEAQDYVLFCTKDNGSCIDYCWCFLYHLRSTCKPPLLRRNKP